MQLLNDILGYEKLSEKKRVLLLAYLMSLSGVLSVFDGMIPKPFFMTKLGLANIVSLVLVRFGRYRLASEVALGRTLAVAMLTGTLFSVTHLLSTAGALMAVFAMAAVHYFGKNFYSFYGISLWGAFASVATQGLLSLLLMGGGKGILFLTSLMLFLGQINALLIAWIANRLFLPQEKTSNVFSWIRKK